MGRNDDDFGIVGKFQQQAAHAILPQFAKLFALRRTGRAGKAQQDKQGANCHLTQITVTVQHWSIHSFVGSG